MEISMTAAAISAALSVLVGFFLGIFYAVIRVLRAVLGITVASPFNKVKPSFRAVFGYVFVILTDLLFFLIAAARMAAFFFLTGDGRMRGYGLFGTLFGFLIYYNTIGRLFIVAIEYIITLLKKAFRLMLVPIARLLKLFKGLCARIFDMPIVKAALARYNNYITKRKKRAALRSRRKKAKKGGYIVNGGTHG